MGTRARRRLVWRTREAEHFGASGWQGATLQGACPVATAAQRAALAGSLDAARADELRRARVLVYDGARATVDAHAAHPHQGCVGLNGSYADCRHYCQPGPIDAWNAQLISTLASQRAVQ